MDEGEVGVGLEDGSIEEDQPHVDAQRGLEPLAGFQGVGVLRLPCHHYRS